MHSASLTVCDTFRFNTAICWRCSLQVDESWCAWVFVVHNFLSGNEERQSLESRLSAGARSFVRKSYMNFTCHRLFYLIFLFNIQCVVSGKALAILQTIFHHIITVSIHSNHRFGSFSLASEEQRRQQKIAFISFAHQWVHAHLVNFPSEQRTRVESGWTISTLLLFFLCCCCCI